MKEQRLQRRQDGEGEGVETPPSSPVVRVKTQCSVRSLLQRSSSATAEGLAPQQRVEGANDQTARGFTQPARQAEGVVVQKEERHGEGENVRVPDA